VGIISSEISTDCSSSFYETDDLLNVPRTIKFKAVTCK